MPLDTQTCISRTPHAALDLKKWQKTVDLMAELYDSACGAIVQFRQDEFNVVVASQNEDNFLKKDDNWSREIQSFCRRIMESGEGLYVEDAVADPVSSCAPAVTEGPVRSYLGLPIYWPDKTLFGTICVIDTKNTNYDNPFVQLLEQFSDLVSRDLKLLDNYERILSLAVQAAVDSTLPEVLTLLSKAVEAASLDNSMKCSILLLEDGKYLRHAAGPSLPQFYNDEVDGIEIGPNVGSCGAAAYLKEPVIVEDIMTHPNWEPFKELAQRANLHACWSEPIMSSNGEALGTFAMYFDKPTKPNKHQVDVIRSSAYNARIAIEHNRLIDALEQSKREAEFANKSKTEFLSHMSHELRTPLNAIIGFSEIINNETFGPVANEKYADYIKDINNSGRFLLEIINDILEISKIEANQVTVNPEPIEVSTLIDDCIRLVKTRADKNNIQFKTKLQDELRIIYADSKHLKQVLINILTNAVKYTFKNDKVIISAKNNKNMVEIDITDHGPGIQEGDLKYVFTPFKQAGNTPDTSNDGVGLGLSLAKGLIEKNGGNLELHSVFGEGTSLKITVPSVHKPKL